MWKKSRVGAGKFPHLGKAKGGRASWHGQVGGELYLSGDTVLFGGIQQAADRHRVSVAVLNLGAPRFTASGPKVLALAAERTLGAHPYPVTPEHTRRASGIMGPNALLAREQGVILETDPSTARTIARESLGCATALAEGVGRRRGRHKPGTALRRGYAACFESALGVVGRRERVDVGDVSIDSRVSLLPNGERGFMLAVTLDVTLPQVQDPEQAARLVAADKVCPYSNATRVPHGATSTSR